MSSQLFTIPALYCPFPAAIHPQVNQIEEHTNQWVLDFDLIENYDTFKKFKASQFGHFIASSFPKADFISICAWSDLNALLFIVDDQIDAENIIDSDDAFYKIKNRFLQVLVNEERCKIKEDGNVIAALSDFWQRIILISDVKWQKKFIKGIEDMFNGGYWQFEHIRNRKKPALEEYIQVRQYFGAAHLSTDALEGVAGIQLPEHLYQDPAIHRLTEICRNAICFSNDLFSLGKELMESGNSAEFNLVTILKNKYQLTIEEAIKAAVKMHNELVREFIKISKVIINSDGKVSDPLLAYVDALQILMRGNIEWSTRETSRYPHIYQN